MTRVLVIDEDRKLCRLLEEHLVREGMVVNFAHDAKSGLRSALSGQHDLVVLDVNLPEFAGLHVVRQLRTHSRIGVVALSPRGEEADKIIGLESGADDYLAKPCNLRELVARICAVSRRLTPSLVPDPARCLTVGDLSLDEGTRTCRRKGEVVDLTSGEFELLLALLHWSGHAVHRNDLYKSVLNREYSPSDRSIDVRVSKLRRKLGPLPDGTQRIRGVRSIGYIYAHPAASQASQSDSQLLQGPAPSRSEYLAGYRPN